jgi:hypothetical protein
VDKLRYSDHDVTHANKFHEFALHVYMERKVTTSSRVPIIFPKKWIAGLYNTGIMNLLEIPHFGRGKDVDNCVKKLLEFVHGGILWMDILV